MLVKPQLCQQDNREAECALGFKSIIIVDVGDKGFFCNSRQLRNMSDH